jgi:hypothetical protein
MQRFINLVAGAIHGAAPGSLVTVGAHSMPYVTDKKFRVKVTPAFFLHYLVWRKHRTVTNWPLPTSHYQLVITNC